jgi:cyclophilin family peptidyl-prolyl cis-trans isomerase
MLSLKVMLLCFAVLGVVAAGSARAANPVVVIDTSLGTIKAELLEDKAPETVKNFLQYVDDKHYDNTIFHRVIPDFMIQGGGMDATMTEKKTRAPVKNESANGLSNEQYTLAMARLGVDRGGVKAADSATAQFFINTKDNKFLDRAMARDGAGYCVFGKVTSGKEVVDKIKAVETGDKGPYQNVPKQPVVIKSIRREGK